MATIYDVAKEAEVSIAAVSLVMNNPETTRVGAAKRRNILKIASKLGYSPSGLAKALSNGSTKILGLVVPMKDPIFFNHFIAEVLAGIQSCLMQRGYHLMIYSHSTKSGRITKGELTQSRYVDGVIVLNTRMCSWQDMKDSIDDLNDVKIPFVMTNCYAGQDAINYVGVNDFEVGQTGATYLVSKGHNRIALISGAARSPMTPELLSGFKAGLKKAGKRFFPSLHLYSEYEPESIHDRLAAWFKLDDPPSAIYCADDQLVPEVYRILEKLNIKIPEEVSVLGRGNLTIASALRPGLTTISIPAFEMGRRSAELLIEVVQTRPKKSRRILLDAPLVKRESA